MSYRDRVAFMTNMRKNEKSKNLYNIFSILYQVTKGRHTDSSWWMMFNCTSKKHDGQDSYISFGIWFSHITYWCVLQQNIFLATNLSEKIFFITKILYIAMKYEFCHNNKKNSNIWQWKLNFVAINLLIWNKGSRGKKVGVNLINLWWQTISLPIV